MKELSAKELNAKGIAFTKEKNYEEAAKYFAMAAEKGSPSAQFNLGKCYEKGYGVKQDYKDAEICYKKAAEMGHEKAAAKADEMYKLIAEQSRQLDATTRGLNAINVLFKLANKLAYVRQGSDCINIGEYPQTIKSPNVEIKMLSADEKGYYTGSDGEKYARVKANPFNKSGYSFSDGGSVFAGREYYFKVEPIKWRILKECGGEVLLFSEKVLCSCMFAESDNGYKNSSIRAFLNNGFFNKAFSEEQKKIILTTTVDNDPKSAGNSAVTYSYDCSSTSDKVFLPSYNDMRNAGYGFSADYENNDNNRKKYLTDYAKATGAEVSEHAQYSNFRGMYADRYWLRTPWLPDFYQHNSVNYVLSAFGSILPSWNVSDSAVGVAPCIRIKL